MRSRLQGTLLIWLLPPLVIVVASLLIRSTATRDRSREQTAIGGEALESLAYPKTIDLGTVSNGTTVPVAIEFRNTGKEPLAISSFKPDCICTSISIMDGPTKIPVKGDVVIPPNDGRRLFADLKISGDPGILQTTSIRFRGTRLDWVVFIPCKSCSRPWRAFTPCRASSPSGASRWVRQRPGGSSYAPTGHSILRRFQSFGAIRQSRSTLLVLQSWSVSAWQA